MITASATDFTDTTASGLFNGVAWHASTSEDAPFLGINLPSGKWDVAIPLPLQALTLTASDVNEGDFQEFVFRDTDCGRVLLHRELRFEFDCEHHLRCLGTCSGRSKFEHHLFTDVEFGGRA